MKKTIENICKEKDISLPELATKMGITYQSLYDCLKKGNPTLKRIQELANALDIEIDVLGLFNTSKNDSQGQSLRCPKCGAELQLVERKREE